MNIVERFLGPRPRIEPDDLIIMYLRLKRITTDMGMRKFLQILFPTDWETKYQLYADLCSENFLEWFCFLDWEAQDRIINEIFKYTLDAKPAAEIN